MQYRSPGRFCGSDHKKIEGGQMKMRVHVYVTGKVQGVWFRASTQQKAQQLGITGWVRNTQEGTVEAVFEGEKHIVKEMIAWCQKGPPLAKVCQVDIKEEPVSVALFDAFSVR